MNNFNPFDFIDPPLNSLEEYHPSLLKKAKQKLLAEFELSDSGIFEYNGQPIDKGTAMDQLELLQDEAQRRFFWELHSNTWLSRLFAQPNLQNLKRLPQIPKGKYKEQVPQNSPLLMPILKELLTEAIRKKDWDLAIVVFMRRNWLVESDQIEAFGPMTAYLEDQKQVCFAEYESIKNQKQVQEDWLEAQGNKEWIALLKILPSQMHLQRDEYVMAMAAVALFAARHLEKGALALRILNRAKFIKIRQDFHDKVSSCFWEAERLAREQRPSTAGKAQRHPIRKDIFPPELTGCILLALILFGGFLLFVMAMRGFHLSSN